MSGLIVSISGIRGIAGTELTADVARKWGAAFGSVCSGGSIVIGRDSRESGEELAGALMEGIVSSGADAIDGGLVPTPVLETGIMHLGAAGGVMITASHNPPEYNGFKFFSPDGVVVDSSTGTKLRGMAEQGVAQSSRKGSVSSDSSLIEAHISRVVGSMDAQAVKNAGFKVAVDGCSSSGGPALVRLLDELGCVCTALDCEPDGNFTRRPEPQPEVLGALSEAIRSGSADVGFALDPDGDRLVVAGPDGTVISEEYTVPLVAMQVLCGTEGGKAVVNLSTSRMIEDVAGMFGASVERSAVGERNVVEKMRETGAVVGGEGNGGVMVPAVNPSRDGVVGTAYILALMADRQTDVSSIVSEIPSYSMTKVKVALSRDQFVEKSESLAGAFEGGRITTIDGFHASWDDRWVHVRPSGTEPVVRVIAEAPDDESVSALVERAEEALSD